MSDRAQQYRERAQQLREDAAAARWQDIRLELLSLALKFEGLARDAEASTGAGSP
jgi:hypothetical protein